MVAVMTYTSLVAQLKAWLERVGDTGLAEQIPTIILQAEFMLAGELKTLLLTQSVTSSFVAGRSWIPKPVRWRETISLNYGTGVDNMERNFLYPRGYEYCRKYWPNPSTYSTSTPPKYYADYLYDYILIVPTPASAYPYELMYYQLVDPLGDSTETNILTANVPDLLFQACMLKSVQYLKNYDQVQNVQNLYDRALQKTIVEGVRRIQDGSTNRQEST